MQMQPRSFETGEELCHAGEVGTRLLVIAGGLAQTLLPPSETGDPLVVANLRQGDAVGAISLVTGEPYTATVVAAMPTQALEMGKHQFHELVERFPRILVNLTAILSRRMTSSTARRAGAERGEAVALIVGRSLMHQTDTILRATMAASAGKVTSLNTREGFDAAVGALDALLASHATVIMVGRAEGRSAPLLLQHVDRVVVLTEHEEEARRFADLDRGIEVLLVGAEASTVDRVRTAGLPVLRAFTPDLQPADVSWIGRHLARTKLGLALGAGGAKGFAEVGALYVLEEAGYTIDNVAGSSIGAIIGTYVAMGMRAAEIDSTLREAFDPETVAEVFKISFAGTSTGLETMTRLLKETTHERTFDDLEISLAVMAVDLTARAPAPFREGPLWQALLAATALAGMFPPYEKGGHRFVDGLALVPVPTGSVVEDGADVTVSVNLMPREVLPNWPGEAAPPPEQTGARGSRMLETLLEVMDLMQLDTSIRHAEAADVVIHPRFGPGSWRDFHLADRFLEAGRQAAEEQLHVLQQLARPQSSGVPT